MTAVHHAHNQESPGAGSAGGTGTAFPGFQKSGLGTPDFFYFSGNAETPSWFKGTQRAGYSAKSAHDEQDDASGSEGEAASSSKKPSDLASQKLAGQERVGGGRGGGDGVGVDDVLRTVRALSDPPVRQTPNWLGEPQAKQLDQEPNPFEHSFSGNTPLEMVHHLHRRARSSSPKSSHGGAAAAAMMHSSNQPGPPGKLPSLGKVTTPDFPNFGWALNNQNSEQSLRSGPLSPSMLNGPVYGNNGNGANNNNAFDPSSITTGLTPGGAGFGNSNYPPHSPATQALFAMMTNTTPGLPSIQGSKLGESSRTRFPDGQGTRNDRSSQSHSNSNSNSGSGSEGVGSRRSPQSHSQSSSNPSPMYSQAMPRPLGARPFAPSNSNNNSSNHPGNVQAAFKAGKPPNPAQQFLQQNMPRPLQHNASTSSIPGQAVGNGNPPTNPLFLLSQAHAALSNTNTSSNASDPSRPHLPHESSSQEGANPTVNADDAVLAAAAGLSGLSTPRSSFVGGPAPMQHTIAPTHLNVSTSANLNIPNTVGAGQQKQQATSAQNAPVGAGGRGARGQAQQGGKPAAAAAGGNKRKAKADLDGLGASAAPASNYKKPKRTSSRRAVANSNPPIKDEDTADEDAFDDSRFGGSQMSGGNDHDMDEDDDEGGSLNNEDGEDGQGGSGGATKGKGGRGPKQQFETEEEKRKNFLERNRQAALKCRQRKKAWLTQLQSKVEYLTQDNESLQSTVAQLREEVATLRNLLASHKDCPLMQQGGAMPGHGAGHPMGGMHQPGQYQGQMQHQQPRYQ